ncbi:MAG: class I SAM-dependent methyltransferase [Chloroflexi bacterium]|nr:class I SAM-dependent methyltransferase [Chloroflexota bacterium]
MNAIKNTIIQESRKWFDVASREALDAAIEEIRTDVFAAQVLASLSGKYVPWTMPALRPGAMATILNDIVINHRKTIVECGGGVSTIYISRLLKQIGSGHLYTIEHDVNWIGTLKEQVASEKEFVTFIHAPMRPLQKIRTGEWYDETVVTEALRGVLIDMLVVDGPNETVDDLQIRYAALPILKSFFAEKYSLTLDDVNRKGEKFILAEWKKQVNLNFHIVSNMAIGLQPNAYKSFI